MPDTRLFERRLTLGGRMQFASDKIARVPHHKRPDTRGASFAIFDLFGEYNVNDAISLNFSVDNVSDEY